MTTPATIARDPGDIIESVLVKGDLAKLTQQERADYYTAVCGSLGLNPLTQPLSYIMLNNKLTLYALKGATDQLRRIYKVSVESMDVVVHEGVHIVTCKVRNGEGRTDVSVGAVPVSSLKGEALANAIMKAETKAKRRATLSICGLGMLDELEVETIPDARRAPAPAPVEIAMPAPLDHDPVTGETGPRVIALPQTPTGGSDWVAWGQQFIAGIKAAESGQDVDEWHSLNAERLGEAMKTAPKVYGSVGRALQAAIVRFATPPEPAAEAPRLPAKESQQLRRALVRKLAECHTLADVEAWRTASADGIASLQDEDRAGVAEWARTRVEQLTEVAEVVG